MYVIVMQRIIGSYALKFKSSPEFHLEIHREPEQLFPNFFQLDLQFGATHKVVTIHVPVHELFPI